MTRIAYLDMLRGYALVSIMLNHMMQGVLRQFTLVNFAIFDAAELFVLLSGFLVGMVWRRVEARQGRRAAQWRFFRRSVQVWLSLVIGGVLLALTSRALLELGLPHTAVWNQYAVWIIERPLGYVATLALMWLQPNLLDVLALYVFLLALTPVTVPLMDRWPWPFAAASVLLWWFAAPLNALLPNHRVDGGLLFNPFGWQMLFHAGVAMGLLRDRYMPVLLRHRPAVTAVARFVALYSIAMALAWRFGPTGKAIADAMWNVVGTVDKWPLDGARFAAIVAWAWMVAVPLSPFMERLAATGLGRAAATVGRGGLVAFVACVLLSVIGDAAATTPPGAHWPRLLAIDLWCIAVLWLISDLWLRLRARTHRA